MCVDDFMDPARYFDHAATTPVDARVVSEMLPYFREIFGNPNSIHGFGTFALAGVQRARERLVSLLGVEDPSQIVFTSGATESNAWILRAYPDAVVSPFEHSSIAKAAERLMLETLPHERERLLSCPRASGLLSVMMVNNETGTIWNPARLRGDAQRVHSDITQAVGRLSVDLEGLDFASFSAHKFSGPKGVGAMYLASGAPMPLFEGGEQEGGRRSGTLNVPGIVGMGLAAQIALDELEDRRRQAVELGQLLLEELSSCPDWQVHGGACRSPYILNIGFRGLEGEALVIEADQAGYAISSGAACSSHQSKPSATLENMGIDEVWRRGAVRISFGSMNSPESTTGLAKTLTKSAEKLRTMA